MAQLTDASLSTKGGLLLTYTVEGTLPDAGHWLLSTTVVGGENGPIHQYGVKVVDGAHVASFDFDHVAGRQHDAPGVSLSRIGDKTTVRFPLDVEAVTPGAKWQADLDVNGHDSGSVEGVVE
ncbi:hypothetical protein V6K52_10115 [Knoellia sp. S7-12]|uniref:hypothetical protein n=1 Tax=Knoellia sp. S7-12 TaxID=3126698 RepID=UPI0033660362